MANYPKIKIDGVLLTTKPLHYNGRGTFRKSEQFVKKYATSGKALYFLHDQGLTSKDSELIGSLGDVVEYKEDGETVIKLKEAFIRHDKIEQLKKTLSTGSWGLSIETEGSALTKKNTDGTYTIEDAIVKGFALVKAPRHGELVSFADSKEGDDKPFEINLISFCDETDNEGQTMDENKEKDNDLLGKIKSAVEEAVKKIVPIAGAKEPSVPTNDPTPTPPAEIPQPKFLTQEEFSKGIEPISTLQKELNELREWKAEQEKNNNKLKEIQEIQEKIVKDIPSIVSEVMVKFKKEEENTTPTPPTGGEGIGKKEGKEPSVSPEEGKYAIG